MVLSEDAPQSNAGIKVHVVLSGISASIAPLESSRQRIPSWAAASNGNMVGVAVGWKALLPTRGLIPACRVILPSTTALAHVLQFSCFQGVPWVVPSF